jgi:hypothetical protein
LGDSLFIRRVDRQPRGSRKLRGGTYALTPIGFYVPRPEKGNSRRRLSKAHIAMSVSMERPGLFIVGHCLILTRVFAK